MSIGSCGLRWLVTCLFMLCVMKEKLGWQRKVSRIAPYQLLREFPHFAPTSQLRLSVQLNMYTGFSLPTSSSEEVVKVSETSEEESSEEDSSSEVISSLTTSLILFRNRSPLWVSSVGSLGSSCSPLLTPCFSQFLSKRFLSSKVLSCGHSWVQRIPGAST